MKYLINGTKFFKNRMSITVIVSKKKFGLHNEVDLLVKRLNSFDFISNVFYFESIIKSLKIKSEVVVFYHLKIEYILISFIYYFFGKKVIYVNHEPNSIRHKLVNNTFIYSLVTAFCQKLMNLISSKVVSPSLGSGYGKFDYVNLNYELNILKKNNDTNYLLYLGREDKTRGFKLLKPLDNIFFFPNSSSDKSEKSKIQFLSKSCAVINFYSRPITQSGVTADSLSKGKITYVSSFDPIAKISSFGGALAVISKIPETNQSIIKLIEIAKNKKIDYDKFRNDFDNVFGISAFKNTWLKIIKEI